MVPAYRGRESEHWRKLTLALLVLLPGTNRLFEVFVVDRFRKLDLARIESALADPALTAAGFAAL